MIIALFVWISLLWVLLYEIGSGWNWLGLRPAGAPLVSLFGGISITLTANLQMVLQLQLQICISIYNYSRTFIWIYPDRCPAAAQPQAYPTHPTASSAWVPNLLEINVSVWTLFVCIPLLNLYYSFQFCCPIWVDLGAGRESAIKSMK